MVADPARDDVPAVHLDVGRDAAVLALALVCGRPAVHSNPARHGEGVLVFGVTCLGDGDPARIANALARVAKAGARAVGG
jgi:hypothetical protein